ncbi:uncharacterized protein TRAVEDRAFT_38325 [Trametes versicolor FP-101664 SS1]|uniref:uncharacterized protein n=1 Tax=Trametes versicolor (strain FP-101664) TaxID=717944 RepID=UPI0004622714|nr:uncharacterized protein TRAVEDRAFT_38325 [Trametes versicolor FP-101664 SS1]EIW56255.1 hypothetical protein TRAVEDRAFT_38325 [Trametes versicolor FP-101664 SS1]
MPLRSISKRWPDYYSQGALELTSAQDVQRFARFLDRYEDDGDGRQSAEDDEEDTDDSEDEEAYRSAESTPGTPARSSSPDSIRDCTPSPSAGPSRSHLRNLTLAIPPSELTESFPTQALAQILSSAHESITSLRLAHAESLLARDISLLRAIAHASSSLTHLTASELGPRACELLRNIECRLVEVELTFDDAWVAAVCGATPAGSDPHPTGAHQYAYVPALPNGKSTGLPTPAPTPATTPAATATSHVRTSLPLPDPLPLLAHSMETLRVLHASNAVFVAVTDTLRYPAVRELRLRLVGVPIVTALVHAFPGVQKLYVYTPYDGCAWSGAAPLPGIDATREANRTSQMYSSFSPMLRVCGFAPGLYAMGLTCPVEHLEVGNVAPRLWVGAGTAPGTKERKPTGFGAMIDISGGVGVNEAEMVRRIVADTRPPTVGFTLGRGWWAPKAYAALSASRKGRRDPENETEALRAMFDPGEEGSASGWAGVRALVVRVEEAGTWPAVTRDLGAMLTPLADSLTTFVLRWDRTSVPFDRVPPDEDEPQQTTSGPAWLRTEALARQLADDLPALRYVCAEVVRDAPALVSRTPSGGGTPRAPRSIWSADSAEAVSGALSLKGKSPLGSPALAANLKASFAAGPPRIAVERRFWRIERPVGGEEGKPGWLCLDALDKEMGARVLREEGLGFEDRVRY